MNWTDSIRNLCIKDMKSGLVPVLCVLKLSLGWAFQNIIMLYYCGLVQVSYSFLLPGLIYCQPFLLKGGGGRCTSRLNANPTRSGKNGFISQLNYFQCKVDSHTLAQLVQQTKCDTGHHAVLLASTINACMQEHAPDLHEHLPAITEDLWGMWWAISLKF